MLHEFLSANREALIARIRPGIIARVRSQASEAEPANGPLVFLSQLIEVLRGAKGLSGETIGSSAFGRGGDLLRMGFTVGEVVHDYADVCRAVTELAEETHTPITTDEFVTMNRCLDAAVAGAVTEYTRQRERSIVDEGTERLGMLTHELRNRLFPAMLAFEALETGNVGISSSTGAVLRRNLRGLRDLIDLSLADVRIVSALGKRERVGLSGLVEEIAADAALEASARSIELRVEPVAQGVYVDVDRRILGAAITNLLQNAFKFTRPRGRVSLRALESRGRALIEIEDQCGGLPIGKVEELFLPYAQRGADRTGVGLGLSISQRGVEANGGVIRANDLPGRGCVFTVDLPMQASP